MEDKCLINDKALQENCRKWLKAKMNKGKSKQTSVLNFCKNKRHSNNRYTNAMTTVKIVQSLSAIDTVCELNIKQQQDYMVNMQHSLPNNRNPTTIACRLMCD